MAPQRSAGNRTLFVTGTGTGVGKTVVAALFARRLREQGFRVAALKPLCSGGRSDAMLLREAAGRVHSLAQVNPWSFRAALSPQIAAEREERTVHSREVIGHIQRAGRDADWVVIEGAGGLLSPLGIEFDARTLIITLPARPLIVAPNRLGVLNEVLLTLEALPAAFRKSAAVVLVAAERSSVVTRTNAAFLRRSIGPAQLVEFPFLRSWVRSLQDGVPARAARAIDQVLRR